MFLAHAAGEISRTKRISSMGSLQKPTKVISVTSGKGGVGKTHTCINLGLGLTKLGKRVLLLDADLGLANINVLLGFEPHATLHDVVRQSAPLAEVIVHTTSGLCVIPAASGVREMAELTECERMVLISGFDDLQDRFDYLIVDTAAGIGENVLHFNMAAEEIIVVIDQEPTSITDAYALIKVLSGDLGVREFNVLVNRLPLGADGRSVYAQLAAVTGRFLKANLKYIGSVAEDDSIIAATLRQRPYLEIFPSARASRDILRLAKRIDANEGLRSPKGGIQFFFRSMLEQVPE